jgi:outer membrane receptor protein involved in Fe transport
MKLKTILFSTSAVLAFLPTLATAQTADPTATAPPASTEADQKLDQDTIIVTATRRNEAALKVPYNISAIGEQQLRELNITDIKKLIDDSIAISAPQNSARFADSVTVRGLNVSPVGANNLEYFIRSTLSYYLDDTPLPNIGFRIKDVGRTETLIGPQGTLYGAGALGGVIRYITNAPKLGEHEARASTSFWQIKGGGMSNDTDLMVNIPLGDRFAVRGVYYRLDDGGYTDRVSNPPWFSGTRALTNNPNPQQNLYKNDDWEKTDGFRISALWQPTDKLGIRYSFAKQDQLAHGTSGATVLPLRVANAVTPADLELYFRNPGSEFRGNPSARQSCGTNCAFNDERATPYAVNNKTIVSPFEEYADRALEMHTLEFDYEFSFAKLHSSTAYYTDEKVGQADYFSQGFAFYCDISFTDIGGCFNSNVPGNRSALITFNNIGEGVNHETRLVSTGDGKLNWIAGFYYSNTKMSREFVEVIPDPDGAGTGAGLDQLNTIRFGGKVLASPKPDEGYFEGFSSDYTEVALFGELTYQITPRWRAMIGARVFNYEDESERELIDYAGDFINESNKATVKDEAVSYFRFNTAFDITPTLLGYFTASQGFRRGGSNPFRNLNSTTRVISDQVKNYGPDSTDNFEIGLKGTMFDRKLSIETSIYQIIWRDTQTYYSQSISGFPVNGTINGPDAISRGWEFSTRYRFNDNWSATFATAVAEAEWNETKNYCTYNFATGVTPVLCGGSSGFSGRTYEKGGELGGTPNGRYDFGVRYNRTLNDDSRIWASLRGTRRGEVLSDRCDTDPCTTYRYPSYTVLNVSAGWRNDNWDVSTWVTNLVDERAIVSNQAAGILGNRIITRQPQTFGLNVSYLFK